MLLNAAYLLMEIGDRISANTVQTRVLTDFHDEQMMRASVIWDSHRQFSFSLGAVVFALLFMLMRRHYISLLLQQLLVRLLCG